MINVILKQLPCPECQKPAVEDDWMKAEVRENPFYLAQYVYMGRAIFTSRGVMQRFTCADGHEFFRKANTNPDPED